MGREYIGDRYNSRPILNLESTGKPQPCRSTYQEFLAAHIVSIFGISSMLVSEFSFGNIQQILLAPIIFVFHQISKFNGKLIF